MSDIGLGLAVDASMERHRQGYLTQQGNVVRRDVLGPVDEVAVWGGANRRHRYSAILHRHTRARPGAPDSGSPQKSVQPKPLVTDRLVAQMDAVSGCAGL
jgi:hypothetical protein